MIITKTVVVNSLTKNKEHYKNKGYDISLSKIEILVSDLPTYSRQKIVVSCDLCEKQIKISYNNYNKNIERSKNNDSYTCFKCKNIKYLNKCIEKYGVENVYQSEEIKNKIKNSKLEKYGDENYNNRNKSKDTCLKIYNSTTPQGNEKIRNKTIKTCLLKYGVESALQSIEIQNKISETNIIKYGFPNPGQSDITKEKIKMTKISNGNQIADIYLNEYKKYRKKIDSMTEKLRKELFGNWDGYDFYDNEFIKENLLLNKYNINYPTIDHKISIFYGFLNNLTPDYIVDIKNLCITKRTINSKKNKKCYFDIIES